MRPFSALFALALVLLFAAPALAQSDVDRAQKLFDDGAAFYLEGEYSKALLQFRKAQAIIDDPVFVFNIALTEHKLGNTERARDAAANVLATGKLDINPTTVATGLLKGSDRVLTARRAARNISRANEAVAETPIDGGEIAEQTTTKSPSSDRFGTLGWTGVALTAVGAGGLIASGILGASAQSDYEIYRDTTASYADRVKAQENLESTRPLGIGLMIGGGVLAAAGIALVVIDLVSEGESTPSASMSFSATHTGGTVGLEGRF